MFTRAHRGCDRKVAWECWMERLSIIKAHNILSGSQPCVSRAPVHIPTIYGNHHCMCFLTVVQYGCSAWRVRLEVLTGCGWRHGVEQSSNAMYGGVACQGAFVTARCFRDRRWLPPCEWPAKVLS